MSAVVVAIFCLAEAWAADPLSLAVFQADVTPPLGAPLCDGLVPPADAVDDPLTARGIVLLGSGQPIVLCAVDWVGIGNGGHETWRKTLATAAGTTPERIAVHCLHQHDAPGYDESSEQLLAARGLAGKQFDVVFARQALERTAAAVRAALKKPLLITHLGVGQARVEQVASNRRIIGRDGKVQFVRYSSCQDEAIRAMPEGMIDPLVRLLAFYQADQPVAVLTYYATHPQSYYGKGRISADFVGAARALREREVPAAAHLHFNGAGGNIAAGKYNDGSPAMRPVLAQRLAQGMKEALENAQQNRLPLTPDVVAWREVRVALPPRDILDEKKLTAILDNSQAVSRDRIQAARDLAFKRRCEAGEKIAISCLSLGKTKVLHLPGEIFVEYQLAAQRMYSRGSVCTAGYGDYGPGYIGTQIAYFEGGYETSSVSRTAPLVEDVLLAAIGKVLNE